MIHSVEEWRDRYGRLVHRAFILRMTPFILIALFFAIAGGLAASFPVVILLSPFYGYYIYDALVSLGVINKGGWPPGVYALGVELPMSPYYSCRYFVPWQSIKSVQVQRAGLLRRRLVNLRVWGSKLPWSLPVSLLGEENLVTLRTLVEVYQTSPPSMGARAPELVLYATTGRERMGNS